MKWWPIISLWWSNFAITRSTYGWSTLHILFCGWSQLVEKDLVTARVKPTTDGTAGHSVGQVDFYIMYKYLRMYRLYLLLIHYILCISYLCHKSRINIQQDCRVHKNRLMILPLGDAWKLPFKVPKISFKKEKATAGLMLDAYLLMECLVTHW